MRKWLPLSIVVASLAFSAAIFDRLPERMAIHWGPDGQPDGFGPRAFGAFGLPAMMLLLWGIMAVVPRLDPRRANIEQFRDSYDLLVAAVVAVLAIIHVAVIGTALGWPVSVGRVAPLAIGLLFVIIGIMLPRFRSNFFVGIRTPWTLSSEMVWVKTHRVGGYMLVGLGVVLLGAALLNSATWLYVIIGGGFLLVATVLGYSYWAWKQEQGPT